MCNTRQRFVADLPSRRFRKGLRVKGVQKTDGIFEMTWSKTDGRATWQWGEPVLEGEEHVIWRRMEARTRVLPAA
ncbi:MAG: hypothetical protein WD942_05745 [Dehalococcoidia bacterium]